MFSKTMSLIFFVLIFSHLFSAHSFGASVFYEYEVIAKTGDTPVGGTGALTTLGNSPSINDQGEVAFQGFMNSGDNGLFFGDANNTFTISVESSNRLIHPAVQITNQDILGRSEIVERLRVSGNPVSTFIRVYNTINSSFRSIARTGGVSNPDPFDSVGPFPSVSNNGEVVFNALEPGSLSAVLAKPSSVAGAFNTLANPAFSALSPMMADNGKIVVPSGSLTTPQSILLRNFDLASSSTIASSSQFTNLGKAPGISQDGVGIAFAGSGFGGDGEGIFISIDDGLGNRHQVMVAQIKSPPLFVPIGPGPDLGFDDSGNPIQFASFDFDRRIGIIHQSRGASGIIDDSFVISFLATPAAASPKESFLPGRSFTTQKGMWSRRIDVLGFDVLGDIIVRWHPILPVIQVGEKVGNFTIDGLGVYDPIAKASTDLATGAPRSESAGDHLVAFWASSGNNQIIFRASHLNACILGVSRLTQGAKGSQPYSKNKLGNSTTDTIGDYGCALSSVAMGINFAVLKEQIAFNINGNPNDLNNALKGTTAFSGAGIVMPNAVRIYKDQLLNGPLGADNTLIFNNSKRLDSRSATEMAAAKQYLLDRLCKEGLPPIIGVKLTDKINSQGKKELKIGHYVIVIGTVNGKFLIADPGNRSIITLDHPVHKGEFVPRGVIKDPPGISQLSLAIKDNADFVITSPGGQKTGFDPVAGQWVQQIPDSSHFTEGLENDQTGAPPTETIRFIQIDNPQEGIYQINVIGQNAGSFNLEIAVILPDDTIQSMEVSGNTMPGLNSNLQLFVDLSGGPSQSNAISTPDVLGLTQGPAQTAITNAGLGVGVVTFSTSGTRPSGSIIDQSPMPGVLTIPGGSVNLVVSTGSGLVTVPDVVGLPQADAEAALVAANLTVGTVTTANSPTVPAWDVISQNPQAGQDVAPNSPVDLVVSLGPGPIPVPNVVGQTQADAETAIRDKGLMVGSVTMEASENVPKGSVIRQDPPAGQDAGPGSSVNLVISSGPPTVTVPDVGGLAQADAEKAITDAKLTLGPITQQPSETVPPGHVISQDPKAGEEVEENAAVSLVVSSGPPVILGKICSYLGNDPKPSLLDQDRFLFKPSKGEIVTFRLEKNGDPHKGNRATLIVQGQRVKGAKKRDTGGLPNEVKAKYSRSRWYSVWVNEQSIFSKGKRFRGPYCIRMEATQGAENTLKADPKWVEP